MEMAEEYGLNRMGENDDDEDDDDEGNATAPPTPAATPKEIMEEEFSVKMVSEQEASVAHEVILKDVEPETSQPHLFNMIMRDCEESPPRMENGPHELDDLDDSHGVGERG
jgi:hypothetical protein